MKSYGEFENLRRKFENSENVKKLEDAKLKAVRAGNFAKVAQYNALKEKLWNEVVASSHRKQIGIIEFIKGMDEEDKYETYLYLKSITFMVDCFDFILASFIEKLQKYDNAASFSQFDNMIKLNHEYQEQVKHLMKVGDEDYFVNFADNSEILRETILDKVREGIEYYKNKKAMQCLNSENTNKNQ